MMSTDAPEELCDPVSISCARAGFAQIYYDFVIISCCLCYYPLAPWSNLCYLCYHTSLLQSLRAYMIMYGYARVRAMCAAKLREINK